MKAAYCCMEVCVHANVKGDLRQDQEVLVKLNVGMSQLQSDFNANMRKVKPASLKCVFKL